ncbi:MAG: hypothetical protein HKM89_07745 [Gemmatimonadales bacterium]|nr:hypothetical protein [Gemmatimonadales bacterium]
MPVRLIGVPGRERTPLRSITLVFLLVLFGPQTLEAQDRWDEAARRIRYLSPAEFPSAPPDVIRALDARACRIPQVWYDSLPHNVIRGEFARPGQEDWAALCSRTGVSQILVFWGGSAGGVDSLAAHEDTSFLQLVDPDRIGFSRRIEVADSSIMWEYFEEYQPPIRLDHQGISDAFVEKGASIFYYLSGGWVELADAD